MASNPLIIDEFIKSLPVFLRNDKEHTSSWRKLNDKEFRVHLWLKGHPRQDVLVNVNDTAAIHPLLPLALQGLLDLYSESNQSRDVYSEEVFATTLNLVFGSVKFKDIDGNNCLMIDASTIEKSDGDHLIDITGSVVTITHTCHAGKTIPYVVTSTGCTMSVTKDELDTRYPDWSARLEVGRSLELTPTAQLHYMCSEMENPNKTIILPDASFT